MARRRLFPSICSAGALFTALVPAAAAGPQGADSCAAAQVLGPGDTFAFDNTGAATDGVAHSSCSSVAQSQIDNDVWFLWTAGETAPVTVTTCGGASVDTMVGVYGALGPCPPVVPIACNDDFCGLQSSVTFPATAGQGYRIRVGTWPGSSTGSGTFQIQIESPPPGDSCSSPSPITGQGFFAYDTTAATTDGVPGPACDLFGNDQIERDVWFAWTADEDGVAVVETCGLASNDTKIAAYDGGAACPPADPIACDDDACGLQSRITFDVTAGSTWLLRVGVWHSAPGGPGQIAVAVEDEVFDCSQPNPGPDVFVGNLVGIVHWGTVGGVNGFSVGATACNGGDAVLPWFGTTAEHPVIASNLYRLMDGRFEQIGLAWVKHGFGAATESACCPCQDPGNNQILGIGCADTYTAGLNGNQGGFGTSGGIGPRSDVDPSTGVFPFPYTTMGQAGDAIYKRLQVANADLDPALNPGALYFGEVQYVSPDDAQSGNGANNASYRAVEVLGPGAGGWTIGFTASTRARKPAVLAWQEADPDVRVATIDVPGDGRYLAAARATANGDGTWHYEYAVQNLSSKRPAGGLTVPAPIGVTVTGVGFHDVDYHSGEVYDSTDWTSQAGLGRVAFSTTPYLANPFGNALRWGTVYTFRFDADHAPRPVVATLSLFQPGTPAAVGFETLGPGGPQDPGTALCFGDGTGAPCPCGNDSTQVGAGCAHSAGLGMRIAGGGSTSIAADDLVVTALDCPPGNTGIFYSGTVSLAPGNVLFDGLQCAGGDVRRYRGVFQSDGVASDTGFVAQDPSGVYFQPGTTYFFQFWSRDVAQPGPCGTGANLSPAYAAISVP